MGGAGAVVVLAIIGTQALFPQYEYPLAVVERSSRPIRWFVNGAENHCVTSEKDRQALRFDRVKLAHRIAPVALDSSGGHVFTILEPGWYMLNARFLLPAHRDLVHATFDYYVLDRVRSVNVEKDRAHTIARGPGGRRGWDQNVAGFAHVCLKHGDVLASTFGMAEPVVMSRAAPDPCPLNAPRVPALVSIQLVNRPKSDDVLIETFRDSAQRLGLSSAARTPNCPDP